MALWVFVALALLVALVACAWARRSARKLEALTQQYWELRYEVGEGIEKKADNFVAEVMAQARGS